MKKQLAALLLCGTIFGMTQPIYANDITGLEVGNLLKVTGELKEKDEGVLVNLWMRDASSEKIVLVRQTKTNQDGVYNFEIDLERELKSGGQFQLQTIAQTENIDSEQFEYYTDAELNQIALDILKVQKDTDEVAKILTQKVNQLSFANEALRKLIDDGKAKEIAEFLKDEPLTEENLEQTLKYASIVKKIEYSADSVEILNFLTQQSETLELNKNSVYKALDAAEHSHLAERLAQSATQYIDRKAFVADMENLVIVTDVYAARGTEGMLLRLQKYDSNLDFTVFEEADNDQDAVLRKILTAVEEGTITDSTHVQDILDVKVVKEFTSGGGGTGGVGFGGGAGGVGGYQADNQLLSQKEFDENDVVTPVVIQFQDMKHHAWAEESVRELVELGIVNGYSNAEFAPDMTLTRAEFCKLLCGVLGIEKATLDAGFGDVTAEDWFSGYVWALYHDSIVTGLNESVFSPNSEISRQDVCTILYRALKKENLLNENNAEISFVDSQEISDYARTAVDQLTQADLLKGSNGYCYPKASMTRAEAAVLIYRVYEYRKGGTV